MTELVHEQHEEMNSSLKQRCEGNEDRSSVRKKHVTRSIRWQLLLAVNLPVAVVLALLLSLNYRHEMKEALTNKHTGLEDEAIAVHQAVVHLAQGHGISEVQHYIDTVCKRMQDTRSPGHHILIQLGDDVFQSRSHQHSTEEMLNAMNTAVRSGAHRASLGKKTIVVGSYTADGVTAFVSEYMTNIRRSIREEVFVQLLVIAVLVLVVAVVVNLLLLRMIAQPMDQMAKTVCKIAKGRFGEQVESFGSTEMQELAQAVNSMSQSLADNDRDHRQQMSKARRLQEHLLPNGVKIPGVTIAHLFQPADDVAGDYYDVIKLPDETWLICVADVTGHGVPAAMGAAMLKTLIMHAVDNHSTPGEILKFINQRFAASSLSGDFVSVFLARWHPHSATIEYANAGHDPGLLVSSKGNLRALQSTGLPLGIEDDSIWTTQSEQVSRDDRLLLITDGVPETADQKNELFGRERLTHLFVNCNDSPPDKTADQIYNALRAHRGDIPAADDMTIVVVQFDSDIRHLPVKDKTPEPLSQNMVNYQNSNLNDS